MRDITDDRKSEVQRWSGL